MSIASSSDIFLSKRRRRRRRKTRKRNQIIKTIQLSTFGPIETHFSFLCSSLRLNLTTSGVEVFVVRCFVSANRMEMVCISDRLGETHDRFDLLFPFEFVACHTLPIELRARQTKQKPNHNHTDTNSALHSSYLHYMRRYYDFNGHLVIWFATTDLFLPLHNYIRFTLIYILALSNSSAYTKNWDRFKHNFIGSHLILIVFNGSPQQFQKSNENSTDIFINEIECLW